MERTGISEYITPLNMLIALCVLLCLSFIVETIGYLKGAYKIRTWKPDITAMRYVIHTNIMQCVGHFTEDVQNEVYLMEYKDMISGRTIVKKLLTPEQYMTVKKDEVRSICASTLRIYIVSPNGYILHKDFVRNDMEENYTPYNGTDITYSMLRISADYFKKKCPLKKNKSKLKTEIKFFEGLPLAIPRKKSPVSTTI